MYQKVFEQLEALEGVYGQLLGLAREKQPVLQANKDIDALRSLTQREEALMAQAAKLERLRMEAVGAIAQELGISVAGVTISELAGHAGPKEEGRLLEAAGGLTKTLRELQTQNDMNRQLLEMNLSFAAFVLDGAAREESLGSAYGASGAPSESEQTTFRLLDSEI